MNGRTRITLVWQDGSTETVYCEGASVQDGCLVLYDRSESRRIPLANLREWIQAR